MQVVDEQKRLKILSAAAELFAAHPFHKVLLSDVAEAAAVGKGTLYTYFRSKEDLYLSVLFSGFSLLMDRLRQQLDEAGDDPLKHLEMVIREIVSFAFANPHLFEVMRTVPGWEAIDRKRWDARRGELKALIESLIRQGNRSGCFNDSNPELTARYIPGLVRSALLDGTGSIEKEELIRHMQHFVHTALTSQRIKGN